MRRLDDWCGNFGLRSRSRDRAERQSPSAAIGAALFQPGRRRTRARRLGRGPVGEASLAGCRLVGAWAQRRRLHAFQRTAAGVGAGAGWIGGSRVGDASIASSPSTSVSRTSAKVALSICPRRTQLAAPAIRPRWLGDGEVYTAIPVLANTPARCGHKVIKVCSCARITAKNAKCAVQQLTARLPPSPQTLAAGKMLPRLGLAKLRHQSCARGVRG